MNLPESWKEASPSHLGVFLGAGQVSAMPLTALLGPWLCSSPPVATAPEHCRERQQPGTYWQAGLRGEWLQQAGRGAQVDQGSALILKVWPLTPEQSWSSALGEGQKRGGRGGGHWAQH